MRTVLLLVLSGTVIAGCGSADVGLPYYDEASFTPRWDDTPARIPGFSSLTTQTGATLSGADLRGRIHVASFLYTRCSVVCPVMVERLMAVQEAAEAWPDVRLVSFSVAPEVDTPESLTAFGEARGIDPARWALVTGDRRQIFEAARTFYFADDGRLTGSAGDVLHTEKVLLVDREGRLRGVYNGTLRADIERLVEDITRLRAG
jgi:protein SCO1/2